MGQSQVPNYKALRKAVNTIRADRDALSALFDNALAARTANGAANLPASFKMAVLLGEQAATAEDAVFDATGTRDALALALRGTGDADFARELLIALIQQGMADDPQLTPGAIEQARGELIFQLPNLLYDQAELNAELQSKTHSSVAFNRPEAVLACIIKAQARICRVAARAADGKEEIGTGFLIGPSCVLTNWHVVRNLTPSGLTASERLLVEFDFSQEKSTRPRTENQFTAAAEWLVAHGEVGALEPADAATFRQLNAAGDVQSDWWMDETCRQAWCNALDTKLDYAVIRLQGTPGARRAHYDLWAPPPPAVVGAAPTSDCLVIHHPLGIGQAVNPGVLHTELNHGNRLFHTASTERGSSGAMLFELAGGNPIGLHYLGLGPGALPGNAPLTAPQQVINVAISLAAIASDIARKPGAQAAIGQATDLMLHNGCLATGEPVFARNDLLSKLTEMKAGTRRVLWIEVPRDGNGNPLVNYGKSYSARIIETLFPEPANLQIRLEAANIPADAAELLRYLAERVIADPAAAAALTIPAKETSADAYDKVLFDFFVDQVLRQSRHSLIWLVIDDLDSHDLPDADSRRFLDRLYNQIGTISNLRVVLIGLKVQLLSLPEDLLARSSIEVRDLANLGQPLRDWLDQRSAAAGPLGSKARDLCAALALTNISDPQALRSLNAYTREKIEPVLRQHFETNS